MNDSNRSLGGAPGSRVSPKRNFKSCRQEQMDETARVLRMQGRLISDKASEQMECRAAGERSAAAPAAHKAAPDSRRLDTRSVKTQQSQQTTHGVCAHSSETPSRCGITLELFPQHPPLISPLLPTANSICQSTAGLYFSLFIHSRSPSAEEKPPHPPPQRWIRRPYLITEGQRWHPINCQEALTKSLKLIHHRLLSERGSCD